MVSSIWLVMIYSRVNYHSTSKVVWLNTISLAKENSNTTNISKSLPSDQEDGLDWIRKNRIGQGLDRWSRFRLVGLKNAFALEKSLAQEMIDLGWSGFDKIR
jgi:hypothetical protein